MVLNLIMQSVDYSISKCNCDRTTKGTDIPQIMRVCLMGFLTPLLGEGEVTVTYMKDACILLIRSIVLLLII